VLDRAYARLTVKTVDAARRTITGLASTPTPDRLGDVIDPLGATFTNPLPLLLHHDRERPVGRVTLRATPAGITFDATLPEVAAAGTVRDRVNEAWDSIQAGLIRGVSVGFRPLEPKTKTIKSLPSGGTHFLKTEMCELSLVTIPANVDATIQTIKSYDTPFLTASGPYPPGVSGQPTRRPMQPTATEHIQNLENKRAATASRLAEILESAADDGATLTDDQAAEHDGLALQVKSLDGDLQRWRELERMQIAKAIPIVSTQTPRSVALSVPRSVTVKPNVPIGTSFVRAACALMVCQGNKHEAAEYAKRWDDSTPEVGLYLKAAIAPGTTTDATWAAPLVNQSIANDFLALLRPATILGKISGLREVPFNTKVPAQSAGGTYGWVGEAKPKPVTKLAFTTETLGINKAAGIIVLTEELIRLSNPSAEALARADMVAGIAAFLDAQFIDPAVAAVAGVNPASITNGAPTAAATASPLADLMGLINHFATNNIPVSGLHMILSATNALSMSFRTNTDGSPLFPGVDMNGGTYKGITFVTSQAAGANVIALQPAYILFADDGGVSIDASREASLQMDSAPVSPADATTVYVSLWQTNSVGLRAERFITWKRANANAVKYLTGAAYAAPSGFAADAPPADDGGTPLSRRG
jgi:HK97 family phage major capsid protein/HK97 family phage prohead protease